MVARFDESDKIGNLLKKLDTLERELDGLTDKTRHAALQEISFIKAEVVELLVAALSSGEAPVRRGAAYGLSKLGDQRALGPLVGALRDEDDSVRGWAAEALGAIGDPEAVPPLVEALKDRNVYVYFSVCNALKAIKDDSVHTLLIKSLDGAEAYVRRRIAKLLGELGNPAAVDTLIKLCSDSDSRTRYEAVEALRKLGSPRAVDALIACLKDENNDVRFGALQALRWLGDERAIGPLVEVCLQDSDMQPLALAALTEICGEHAALPVSRALQKVKAIVAETSREVVEIWAREARQCPRKPGPLGFRHGDPAELWDLMEHGNDPEEPGITD